MIQTIDLRESLPSAKKLYTLIPRASLDAAAAVTRVLPLIEDVRLRGVAALREQAMTFDGVSGHELQVPQSDLDAALAACDPNLRVALETMIVKLRLASQAQVPEEQVTRFGDGASIRQRWQPVRRVGLYAPGGKAVYPSSVVMNVIAAQTAGVSSIALASPAQPESGGVHPTILAAAALLGVTEVYAIGGAGAIAAFAYGVHEIDLLPVDVVTGPGNIFVAAAKRVVNGVVGIDAEAGTTEILIIADEHADPRFVAADLLSQAEHDEAAAAVLVTTSSELLQSVEVELERQLSLTQHESRARTALSGPQSALILVDSLHSATTVSNAYAPEHLSLQTSKNDFVLSQIDNAGAIFVGAHTPVSLGDYLAGSNHVLPTGGTARFASGLGAYTFLRPQQIIQYEREALHEATEKLVTLANAEGLPAHGDAVQVRFGA